MNILTITNLTKVYPNGVRALDNVSLQIGNGMFGLLGANGAGKSTLMRTIAALQLPSSGTISFNGTDIGSSPDSIRKQLGYLPQQFGVYPRVSAEKLLDHLALLKGIAEKKKRRVQVHALLEQTNLFADRKRAVHTFSGGMKQRFGIAQALLADPQIIVVDEPTAGLDPTERSRFLNLLSEIGENVIVILSTHIVADVYDLCPQMAVLSDGQIILEGNPMELTRSLKNQVWTKEIDKEALEECQSRYEVIATRLIEGKTHIDIVSKENPKEAFAPKQPTLEDLYFSLMRSSQIHHKTSQS